MEKQLTEFLAGSRRKVARSPLDGTDQMRDPIIGTFPIRRIILLLG
jgi:hypothetical protein